MGIHTFNNFNVVVCDVCYMVHGIVLSPKTHEYLYGGCTMLNVICHLVLFCLNVDVML